MEGGSERLAFSKPVTSRSRSRLSLHRTAFAAVGPALIVAFLGCKDSAPAPQPTPMTVVLPEAPAEAAAPVEQMELAGDFAMVDVSPPMASKLRSVVPSLSDLALPVSALTTRYIEHFGGSEKGRKAFLDRYHRSFKYRELIERKLLDADLPQDLLYLVAIESAFNPQAVSPVGAVGLFQLMQPTAEKYGLTVNAELDERRSLTKATDAAIAYLTFLKETFGAWDLALAAYNCGEERLQEALDDARDTAGHDADTPIGFAELADKKLLPRETIHFVPMVHAFSIVAHNRELLEIEDASPLAPLQFAELAVPGGTRLALLAKASNVSVSALRELNQDILTDRVPIGKDDQLVLIPVDALERTIAALPAILRRDPEAQRLAEEAAGDPAPAAADTAVADAAPAKNEKAQSTSPGDPFFLTPSVTRQGAYVLTNGFYVELKNEPGDLVEVSASIALTDPTNKRKSLEQKIEIGSRSVKLAELSEALGNVRRDLAAQYFGDAAKKLRAHVAKRRRGMLKINGGGAVFAALSERVFPDTHLLHGGMLVGNTDYAEDLFLEPEPLWAFETTITLRGPVTPDTVVEPLEKVLTPVYSASKGSPLASAGRLAVAEKIAQVGVAWASPTLGASDETAAHLAFVLACHPKLGRITSALRSGTSMAGHVACALELSAAGTVGWVYAMPIPPSTTEDVEVSIEDSVAQLMSKAPSADELGTAKALLRTDLVRETKMASTRGLPRYQTSRNADRILGKLKATTASEVAAAMKTLFSKDHRVVVTGG